MTCSHPDVDHHKLVVDALFHDGIEKKEAETMIKKAEANAIKLLAKTEITGSIGKVLNCIKESLSTNYKTPDYWTVFHCFNHIIEKRRKKC